MSRRILLMLTTIAMAVVLAGCQQSASRSANAQADAMMYKPVAYANAAAAGPCLVVIPGEIKSANASFCQKITPNNIADFAEMELTKANFQVLERSDMGPLLEEVAIAANMGDAEGLKKLKKGKFETTNWFVRFDILKAEPVAQASNSFDGDAFGAIAGAFIPGRAGYATDVAMSSAHSSEAAKVWIVGMRYKVIDATTGRQVTNGYFEQKMEVGGKASSFMGVSQAQAGGATLDTLAQRLVQLAVKDLDAKK